VSQTLLRASFVPIAVLAGSLLLTGCRSAPTPVEYAREYPADPARTPAVLDIQVFRHTKSVELSNTTATPIGKCTLWLNRRYSFPIDGIPVGAHLELPLSSFRDEFSEAFRGGGFFASEAPDTLVMVEAELADEAAQPRFYSMIVVKGQPD
jgi:hypothetical protein